MPRPRRRRPKKRLDVRALLQNRKAVIAAASVLVVLLAVVGFSIWKYVRISNKVKLDPVQSQQVRDALDDSAASNGGQSVEYVLFLGGDMRPGQKVGRSDSIMVARIDAKAGTVRMLSIPRDTRVSIPGHGTRKINTALALGGPAMTIETVKAFTGLPINHFVLLDFRGFADIVDAVGGVEIDIKKAIKDKHGANTGGVSNVTYIPAGRQRLDGRQALTFVRSRQYADGDFSRMRNQQVFLTALAKQVMSGGNLDKLPGVAEAAADNMKTDMDLVELSRLAQLMKRVGKQGMKGTTLPGRPQMIGGASYVVVDEAAKKRIVEAFLRGELLSDDD